MAVDAGLLKEVQAAVQGGSSERRSRILQHVTDLFVFGSRRYSESEISVFDDVMLRLTVEIELSARALLAVRLSSIPNAPPQTLRKLACDDAIEVAGPVLRHSDRLDETALAGIAQRLGQDHLFAISERIVVAEKVTDILLERGDRRVALRLATNSGAKFSDGGFRNLVQRSEGDDRLAAAVGQRADIPRQIFLDLVAKASNEVRLKLEGLHPEFKAEVRQAVAEVTSRIRAEAREQSHCDPAVQQTIGELARSGQLNDERLRQFAEAGSFQEATIALSLMSDLSIEFVEGVMIEERSETLLIIARMIGLSWPTVKAILLLRAGKGGFSRHELEEYHTSFKRLKSTTANEIVRFYRAQSASAARKTFH